MTKLITETPDHPIPFLIDHLQTKQDSPGKLHRALSGSAALWAQSSPGQYTWMQVHRLKHLYWYILLLKVINASTCVWWIYLGENMRKSSQPVSMACIYAFWKLCNRAFWAGTVTISPNREQKPSKGVQQLWEAMANSSKETQKVQEWLGCFKHLSSLTRIQVL